MPETRLTFKGGVNVEATPTANRGGWSASNLIRFKFNFPEKIGGWARICDTAFGGVCRALHWWTDLYGLTWLSIGTNTQLALIQNGTLSDITPDSFGPGEVSSPSGKPYTLRIWSLDNFGENLIAVPSGGGLYQWLQTDIPETATTPLSPGEPGKATLVAEAPHFNQGGLVAMPQRIVVLFGSSLDDSDMMDPLLLRWSGQEDYTDWTPSTTNQAGSFRIPRGSRIVGALQFPLTTLVWTNLDLWAMTYIGFPLVFSVIQISSLCNLISQNAACALGSTAYWMSDHGFFRFSVGGAAEQIPCSVWDVVYKDIDFDNQDKCLAGPNYNYSEIFWFYPSLSGGTGEIDSYVKYNIAENLWDYGQLARTAWTDQNSAAERLSDGQFGADLSGFVQQHEIGFDADGAAMTGVMIRSAFIDIEDGGAEMVVNRLIPDFKWDGDSPQLTVKVLFRNFSGETITEAGPFAIDSTTNFVTLGTLVPFPVLGIRAREVAIEIDCDALGTWFRLGTPRIRVQPDGKL